MVTYVFHLREAEVAALRRLHQNIAGLAAPTAGQIAARDVLAEMLEGTGDLASATQPLSSAYTAQSSTPTSHSVSLLGHVPLSTDDNTSSYKRMFGKRVDIPVPSTPLQCITQYIILLYL
jgi:hypothetical protein